MYSTCCDRSNSDYEYDNADDDVDARSITIIILSFGLARFGLVAATNKHSNTQAPIARIMTVHNFLLAHSLVFIHSGPLNWTDSFALIAQQHKTKKKNRNLSANVFNGQSVWWANACMYREFSLSTSVSTSQIHCMHIYRNMFARRSVLLLLRCSQNYTHTPTRLALA